MIWWNRRKEDIAPSPGGPLKPVFGLSGVVPAFNGHNRIVCLGIILENWRQTGRTPEFHLARWPIFDP
jgi:hypothetical protein